MITGCTGGVSGSWLLIRALRNAAEVFGHCTSAWDKVIGHCPTLVRFTVDFESMQFLYVGVDKRNVVSTMNV